MTIASTNPPVHRAVARPAALATALGIAFFASLSIPALYELPEGMTVGQAILLLSSPIWFLAFLRRSGPVFDPLANLAALWVLALSGFLILWAVLSSFGVDNPIRAVRPMLALFAAFAMYFLMVGTATSDRLRLYITVLCFSLAATAVFTVIGTFVPSLREMVYPMGAERAWGFFKNPNQFGIAISTVVPVALGMLYSQRGNRLLWLLCIASLLVALKLTGSKANLLIMAVFIPSLLIVFAYVTYDGIKRFWMILLTILGCVVLGALVIYLLSILNPRAFHLLEDVIVDGEATNSLHARARVWEQSIQSLKDNPLLGVGAGQPILTLSHSHNLALDFARTLGAPGLVFIMTKVAIILAICASTVLYAMGQKAAPLGDRRLCIALMFAPVAYLGANFSSDSLGPTTSPYLYGVLFLGLASRSLLKPDPLRFRSRAVVR